ncbi:amidase [Allonocardiopsis opalescens]|uniref:Amidase n=1 Tax=Allonocardiopsis opalescens TaxID=1144618 RepID=A0A2T0PXF3_9ACTN|nr:amidase [Allonocardiopsis opalescens]PRX96211.1 amidase [Allonocardiopsis opalescens]
MPQIHDLTAIELSAAMRAGELSPVDVTEHYLERIDRLDARLGAFVTVTPDLAREQAAEAERRLRAAADPAALPPLLGLPVPIKDLDMLAGVRLTWGSKVFTDFVAPVDDAVVARLRAAGIVVLGKTNTPEFGLSCHTENGVAPPARTPWDLGRSAGGSSGGAAAAVAAGLAPIAQGSDGGGSVRIPCSACGLFGIKPTRGRISKAPVAPDLIGLGTAGPLARTVRDAAWLLDAMLVQRPGDLYTAPPPPPGETFLGYAEREPGRLRIARFATTTVPGSEVHPDVMAAYEETSKLLVELGHEVTDIDSPFPADLIPQFEKVWATMPSLYPVTDDQVDRLEPLTRWLLERGRRLSAAEYVAATAALQNAVRAALPLLESYDAVLNPTIAQPPAPIGHFTETGDPAEEFDRIKRFAGYPAPYNVTGQPAVSVPTEWTADGLPIGMMLAGRTGDEKTLISLSAQLEAARPWAHRTPPMW